MFLTTWNFFSGRFVRCERRRRELVQKRGEAAHQVEGQTKNHQGKAATCLNCCFRAKFHAADQFMIALN